MVYAVGKEAYANVIFSVSKIDYS